MRFLPFTIANNFKYSYVKHCVGDFETCFATEERRDVRVWGYGLYDYMNDEYEDGNHINGFLDTILSDKFVYDIAFHNVKFDGSFILPQLYRRGYDFVPNKKFMEMWTAGEDVSRLFTHNITNMGQWFSVTIGKPAMATKTTPAFVHIWDSMKLFPQSLKEIGKQYNKEYHKLDFSEEDYARIRPEGYTMQPYEREYLRGDCLTLGEALRSQYRMYGKMFRTRASKAFNFFKESCVADYDSELNLYKLKYEGLSRKMIPDKPDLYGEYAGTEWKYAPRDLKNMIRSRKLRLDTVTDYHIPDYKTWLDLKKAYRGGISYVNPFYREKSIIDDITSLDMNSMYPTQMHDKPIPFGAFTKEKGKPDNEKYCCWVAVARVSFKIKHPEYLPCIQMKHEYGREWLTESTDYKTWGEENQWNEDIVYFSSVDFETFQECYDFTVHQWLWYYGFTNMSNADGQRFISKYYAAKEDAGQRRDVVENRHDGLYDLFSQDDDWIVANNDYAEAKVIMNSAYGKHGTKYNMLSKRTDWDGERVLYSGEKEVFNKEPDDPSHYYIPYALFVTSYARQELVRTWNSFVDGGVHPVYCDTDSIHYIGTGDMIPQQLHPHIDWDKTGKLALWKVDGYFVKGRYIRSKSYIEVEENGQTKVTCAGATPGIKKIMNWDNFTVGFDAWVACEKIAAARQDLTDAERLQLLEDLKSKHCKLKPKQYDSGVALEPQNFQIRAAKLTNSC